MDMNFSFVYQGFFFKILCDMLIYYPRFFFVQSHKEVKNSTNLIFFSLKNKSSFPVTHEHCKSLNSVLKYRRTNCIWQWWDRVGQLAVEVSKKRRWRKRHLKCSCRVQSFPRQSVVMSNLHHVLFLLSPVTFNTDCESVAETCFCPCNEVAWPF